MTTRYRPTGDAGTTRLLNGAIIEKGNPRVGCYGAVDETNVAFGLAKVFLPEAATEMVQLIEDIQERLFVVGSELANPSTGSSEFLVGSSWAAEMQVLCDQIEGELAPLKAFLVPGSTRAEAFLHLARVSARRAEREFFALREYVGEELNPATGAFLNRLSRLCFMLARKALALERIAEQPRDKRFGR